jgi:hypothetical protein
LENNHFQVLAYNNLLNAEEEVRTSNKSFVFQINMTLDPIFAMIKNEVLE